MQIASVPSSKQFIALVPFNVTGGVNSVTYGAYADTGTATSVNVFVALDASARYNQSISNLYLLESSKLPTADDFGVGIYFGGRIDAGTHIEDVWVDSPSKYSYYFTAGGINVDFDRGWRSDGAGIAGIYWRAGADNFRIANGTITNDQTAGSPYDGVAVMLDASQCLNGFVRMNESNIKTEIAGLASGMGIYTMLDCPAFANGEQFFLDMEGVWNSINSAGTVGNNYSSFAMIPANDVALNLAILNSQMQAGSGSNTTQRFIGLPALARNDLTGATGFITSLFYAPPFKSAGIYVPYQQSLMQSIGDSNFNQIYQYGIPASTFLYSDTAYAALPNATTLNAGQILAPPAYWSEANGKRYALDVVYRTGTTGTPNSGATTCIGSLRTRVLTCSSATDLSPGQRIKIGVDDNKTIKFIDATHPDAVRVNLTSSLAASYSREPLAFSAPLLASEIQMPTKSPGAPATQSWLQGDTEQNSRAAANGVAAWVNVAPGTPGSWAGIPLGDSNGKIAESQLYSARTAHAFCSDTAASSSTILLFGAGGSQNSCTQSPGPQALQQILMNTSGTLSNLAVRCGHSGSEPSSGRFTVWDLPSGSPMSNASSGINTGLSVIIGNSPANANRTILDTTHSFSYAAGDMIRIQFTTGANEALSDCTAAFNY